MWPSVLASREGSEPWLVQIASKTKNSHCKCIGFRGMSKKIALLLLITCHYQKIEARTFQSDLHLTLEACTCCYEVRG